MEHKQQFSTYMLAFIGMMASVVFISNFFSIPAFSSRLHIANAVCLLSGMLFGGVYGGLAAAIGSALYDIVGGWGMAEAVITFINKGLMALVCGIIVNDKRNTCKQRTILLVGSIAGAMLYITLYLFKSYLQLTYFAAAPLASEAIAGNMLGKLQASAINGVFAVIVAPLLYAGVHPAMKEAGLYKQLPLK